LTRKPRRTGLFVPSATALPPSTVAGRRQGEPEPVGQPDAEQRLREALAEPRPSGARMPVSRPRRRLMSTTRTAAADRDRIFEES